MAKEYLTPTVSYNQIPFEAMHLNPAKVSLAQEYELSLPAPAAATVSVIKVSEDNSKALLRCFNATEQDIPLPKSINQLNLAEQSVNNQAILKPNQVVTLVVEV